MMYFGSNEIDYTAFLKNYAEAMHTKLDGNTLHFPTSYGEGFMRTAILPNGLQALLYHYQLNQDVFINRLKSKREYYVLNCDEISEASNSFIKIGKEFIGQEPMMRSAALLTSSLFDFGYIGRKGMQVRGVNILIEKDWIANYLGISLPDKVIEKYIALKTAAYNFEPLDVEYRNLINEMLAVQEKITPLKMVVIQNRIMLLIERFFTRLYKKIAWLPQKKKITDKEIQRLMHLEALLVRDLCRAPLALPEMARIAMMSQTKMKSLFKILYEYSPHEYFQKSRMLKAKVLLNSKKYTIKEAGTMLGFKNLSNFTIAFKKEFGMLPSEI